MAGSLVLEPILSITNWCSLKVAVNDSIIVTSNFTYSVNRILTPLTTHSLHVSPLLASVTSFYFYSPPPSQSTSPLVLSRCSDVDGL